MAKMIAILNEPERCEWCPFNYDEIGCSLDNRTEHLFNSDFRVPDWCPLIPEPERMTEREVIEIENAVTYTYKNIYAKGWNACLDALEGKENE